MVSERTQDVLDQTLTQPESPARQLTVDEAIAIAIQLQQNEQFAEADAVYSRVFDVAPDHPDALHYAGVLAHQQGRHGDAVALIERSLQLVADRADWHSNHGIVLQAQGRIDDAIRAYERA